MASQLRPIVNQRLYFARLHCDWIAQEQDKQQLPKRVIEQSLGESVIFHLVMAYRAYLSEVGEAYLQPQRAYSSALELLQFFSEQKVESAQVSELALLEGRSEPDGWLRDLLALHMQSVNSAHTLPAVAVNSRNTLAITLTDQADELSLERGLHFHHCLSVLIETQRLCLEEW